MEIPHYKTGKKIVFDRDEVIEYIKKHRVKTREEIEEEAINYIVRKKM